MNPRMILVSSLLSLANCQNPEIQIPGLEIQEPIRAVAHLRPVLFGIVHQGELVGDSFNIRELHNFGGGQIRLVLKKPIPDFSGIFVQADGNRRLFSNVKMWNNLNLDVNVWRWDCVGHCVPTPIGTPSFAIHGLALE